jgi:aryl-alcohol dehydrogenase-like predicted oxidoreductase
VLTPPDTRAATASGRPEYLREQCEQSLRRLGVERIDLFQLHRIDPQVPAYEQFGVLDSAA